MFPIHPIVKRIYLLVPCLVHCLKPILVEVYFVSRSQESFLLRREGKAREEKRGCRENGERRRGSERRALASPVTCSPTLIHLFGGRGAQPTMRIPDDHPPRALGARARIWVVCFALYIHAVLCMRRNSDSHNWRRHLLERIVLSRYGPAKIYALCNCAIRSSTRPRCDVQNATFEKLECFYFKQCRSQFPLRVSNVNLDNKCTRSGGKNV